MAKQGRPQVRRAGSIPVTPAFKATKVALQKAGNELQMAREVGASRAEMKTRRAAFDAAQSAHFAEVQKRIDKYGYGVKTK